LSLDRTNCSFGTVNFNILMLGIVHEGIETLFTALKTPGFNLESTHFCHAERLSKLVALLALAFCWAMLAGLWQHRQHPMPLKAHGRKAKSLFRSGCDFTYRSSRA
jgi:hypothetical protein